MGHESQPMHEPTAAQRLTERQHGRSAGPRQTPLTRVLLVLAVFALMVGVIPATTPQSVAAADAELRTPRYFADTGFWVQGAFREYWETHGGLYIFGYPITSTFDDDGIYRQYFERAIFEYHPEHAGTEYEVLLMRLGAIRTEGREAEAPFVPLDTQPDENCNFYPETGHRLCFGFRTYWNANGGLSNFGYPISEEFDEANAAPPAGDGQTYTVQYFERTRFEYHPEYAGTQFETLLGLLGSEYLIANPAPDAALARQDPHLPPADPTQPHRVGPHAALGFNIALRGDEEPDRVDFNNRALQLASEAGSSWVHLQVRWEYFERWGPGSYDPAPLDRVVEQLVAYDQRVLVSVVGPTPEWMGLGGALPEKDNAGYAALMYYLADRYAGRIQAWEIWNEQNLASNFDGMVDIPRYAELLKAGYQAVKAADPNAIVLFGALTPTGVTDPTLAVDDIRYIDEIYAWNDGEISRYFDVLGAHPGSNDNTPDQSWPNNPGTDGWSDHNSFYFRRVAEMHEAMTRHGDGAKQIWLTEFGWTTANQAAGYEYGVNNSEEDQAAYLVRAFEIARQEWPWMGIMFVWNLNYSVVTDPADEKHPWAVLNADWSPRPAYEALKAMPKE